MAYGIRERDISLEPFQRRFEEMEAAISDDHHHPKDAANTIAIRLGWFRAEGWPDGPRVRRVLGLRPTSPTHRRGKVYPPHLQERVAPETAKRLCEAMSIDLHEVGL